MTIELTAAQKRELLRVRDTGHSKTRAGFSLRVKGLTEFVWKLRNGEEVVDSTVDRQGWYDQMQGAVCQGERITAAGLAALSNGDRQ
jgi:hypothetical protein